jgi:hypothetical protein
MLFINYLIIIINFVYNNTMFFTFYLKLSLPLFIYKVIAFIKSNLEL